MNDYLFPLLGILGYFIAAYYWFTSRMYNARESNYKDQAEEALLKLWRLDSAAHSVWLASNILEQPLNLKNEINKMEAVRNA